MAGYCCGDVIARFFLLDSSARAMGVSFVFTWVPMVVHGLFGVHNHLAWPRFEGVCIFVALLYAGLYASRNMQDSRHWEAVGCCDSSVWLGGFCAAPAALVIM